MKVKEANFLVADDYATTISLIISTLKDNGFTGQTFPASNGLEALEVLKGNKIDFIISDVVMPEMTGIEFLKKVKESPAHKSLPFLMLTAESDRSTVLEAIKLGVTNYLIKPWSPETLVEKIIFCWGKHHTE